MRRLLAVGSVCVLFFLTAGLVLAGQSAEVIGQIRLPCGCPGFIFYNQVPGEYALVIPTHREVYKFVVDQEDGKLTATMLALDGSYQEVYTSVPPYEKWWSERVGWLTEGMGGFRVLSIIRNHYQKGNASVIKIG